MSDLKKYIVDRKKKDKEFAHGFDEGYEQFKIVIVAYSLHNMIYRL
jgi:hypothetical protein